MKFSEKLQKLRKENKLSQEQLADKLDVSRQAVSKWESGQTYPEMDKLLTMCKIFNCTLDELTNDEISDFGTKQKNKSIGSNLVDEVLEIINRTCKIFRNLSFGTILKIVFEMFIVFLIINILKVPVNYIYDLGTDVFLNFGSHVGQILSSIFKFILYTAYFILGLIVFVYVYKIRVLDYYERLVDDNTKKEKPKEDKETNNEKNGKVIRNNKYTFFDTLGEIVIACIKIMIVFMAIPFVFSLFFLSIGLILNIVIIFKGVFFLGIIPAIIACIAINITLLELVFNFVFNKKNDLKRIFLTFIISIVVLGIGTGITAWDFTSMNYIEGVPERIKASVYEVNYPVDNNTTIIDPYYDNITYVIDENMGDNIKISVKYYSDYSDVTINRVNNEISIYGNRKDYTFKDFTTSILKDLSKKQLYLYRGLYSYDITVYTTSKNKELLFSNREKYYNNQAEIEYNNEIKNYENKINEYEKKISELEDQNDQLSIKNNELESQINDYKETIKEYTEKINGLLKN